eukprot:scaffold1241_cov52-Cyclotella_meneghiniana.AAC.4
MCLTIPQLQHCLCAHNITYFTGDEFVPGCNENASDYIKQAVLSNYYSYSKDSLQATSNEIIKFIGDNSKEVMMLLKDNGLVRRHSNQQAIPGIISKLMSHGKRSQVNGDLINSRSVYYKNDDEDPYKLDKIGYALGGLVKRISLDDRYNQDLIEPAFAANLLKKDEGDTIHKLIKDLIHALIEYPDEDIVTKEFKDYLKHLFDNKAHHFGAQICHTFMQIVETNLKIEYMNESGSRIENLAEFFSYDKSGIQNQMIEHEMAQLVIAKTAINGVISIRQAQEYAIENDLTRSDSVSATMSWMPAFMATPNYNGGVALPPFDQNPLPGWIHQHFTDMMKYTGKPKYIASKPLVLKYTMGLKLNEGCQDLIQNKDRTAPLISRNALESGNSYPPGGGFKDDELKDSIEYAPIIVRGLSLSEHSIHIWDNQRSAAFPNQDEMHQMIIAEGYQLLVSLFGGNCIIFYYPGRICNFIIVVPPACPIISALTKEELLWKIRFLYAEIYDCVKMIIDWVIGDEPKELDNLCAKSVVMQHHASENSHVNALHASLLGKSVIMGVQEIAESTHLRITPLDREVCLANSGVGYPQDDTVRYDRILNVLSHATKDSDISEVYNQVRSVPGLNALSDDDVFTKLKGMLKWGHVTTNSEMHALVKSLQAVAKPSSVNHSSKKAPSVNVARNAIKEIFAQGGTLWVLVEKAKITPELFKKSGDYGAEFSLALQAGRVFDVRLDTLNGHGNKCAECMPIDPTANQGKGRDQRRYYNHGGEMYMCVRKHRNAIE